MATALLKAGCAAVVAMAYSVYAVAAAEFMAAFYEALFTGDSVGQAVTAGRRRLFGHDGRPSPNGDMPLADWLVPVHYLRREVRFPQARTARPARAPSLDAALDQMRAAPAGPAAAQDPLAAVDGVFVGRDDLFYQGVPGRFADISTQDWTAVLEDAARVGLLTGLGAGMYRIHPALPGYLAAGWYAEDPASYAPDREACELALCIASAYFSRWATSQIDFGDAGLAYALIGLQRRTLGAMLGHALDHRAWDEAEDIVRALNAYWDTRGLGGKPPPGPTASSMPPAAPAMSHPRRPVRCGCTALSDKASGSGPPGIWTRPGKPTGRLSPT